MRILLIEDDKQAAAYLVKGLDEAGFNVEHASDGRDGLFLATSEPFDVVIIDRMLPGLDGLAIIQALRAQGRQCGCLDRSRRGVREGAWVGAHATAREPARAHRWRARSEAPELAVLSGRRVRHAAGSRR